MLFMLSLAGLVYCAILQPRVFRNPGHLVMRSLCYLGLGSLISQGAFMGYLLWHRVAARRLHRECRRLVLALAQSQLKGFTAPVLAGGFPRDSPDGSGSLQAPQAGMSQIGQVG